MPILRHPLDETLHRLMDGALAPRAAATVEHHVAICDRCRALVDQLERLRRLAAAAPREVMPPVASWDALHARIARTPQAPPMSVPEGPFLGDRVATASREPAADSPRSRRWQPGRWVAALALVLALGVASIVIRAARLDGDATVRGVVPRVPMGEPRGQRADAMGDVASSLPARPGLLSAETLRAAAENIRQLDAAVRTAEAAIAAHPDHVHLETMLARTRRQHSEHVESARALVSDQ